MMQLEQARSPQELVAALYEQAHESEIGASKISFAAGRGAGLRQAAKALSSILYAAAVTPSFPAKATEEAAS